MAGLLKHKKYWKMCRMYEKKIQDDETENVKK